MTNKRVTLRDIAEHLGINTSTVSRALSDASNSKISPEVVRQVRQTAKKLGYKQNAAAYALKMGSTKTVGIIIPDLMNPLFPPIIRGIQATLDQYGYTALLSYSENNIQLAQTEVDKLLSRGVDGVVYAAAFREDPVIGQCQDHQVPIVLVNRSIDAGNVDTVKVDDAMGIQLALDHLYSLGHREIGLIAGPSSMSVSNIRHHAFLAHAHRLKLKVEKRRIVEAQSFSEDAGEVAATALIGKNPELTAVVASNDLLAMGCIRALHQFGYQCPGRLSVVGYNNMPYLEWFATPLTTVAIPHFQMGERTAELLLKRMKRAGRDEDTVEEVLLKPRLVVRGSTAPPSRGHN